MNSQKGEEPIAYSGITNKPIYMSDVDLTISLMGKARIITNEQEKRIGLVLGSEPNPETLQKRCVERV